MKGFEKSLMYTEIFLSKTAANVSHLSCDKAIRVLINKIV